MTAPASRPAPVPGNWTKFTAVQRAMSRRMTAAAAVPTAHQFIFVRIDRALGLVDDLRTAGHPVSVTTVLLAAAASALSAHPIVAAEVDHDEHSWRIPEQLNVGIAVAAERGLVVPVVRDVRGKTPAELAPELNRVIGAARAGGRDPALFAEGHFTITNLGRDGIDGGIPLLNYPQSAILGVSSASRQPVAEGDDIVIRTVVRLGMTIDHRLIDGLTAARVLRDLRDILETPPSHWGGSA